MEPRFGSDLSKVRVHGDVKAAAAARSVGALAFTVGDHIVFGAGAFRPERSSGRRLLAHELAHTLQQAGQSSSLPGEALRIGEIHDTAEVEADAMADRVLRSGSSIPNGTPAEPSGVPSPAVLLRRVLGQPVLRREAGAAPQLPAAPRPPPPLPVIEREAVRATARSQVRITARAAARPAARAGLRQVAATQLRRLFWRKFWQAVVRRFAVRGAVAAVLSAADGPLPIGEIISLGLAVWTVWEIVQIWDELTAEAEREAARELDPSPQPQAQPQPGREEEPDNDCFERHPYASVCEGLSDRDEVVIDFLMNNGRSFTDLGDCFGMGSFGPGAIEACGGAPGERWHCRVNGTSDQVSVFGCLCCDQDGTTSLDWRGPHWSVNLSRRR